MPEVRRGVVAYRFSRIEMIRDWQPAKSCGSINCAQLNLVLELTMASPFPGMDPYLEQHWRDVHASLIIYARDQLQPRLPKSLRSRVEERVFVESDQGEGRSMYPDVRVVERYPRSEGEATGGGLAVAEPLVIQLGDEPVSQGFIEIIDVSSGNKVVTVIEFLSPSNKLPGEGQDQYLEKQQELRAAGVSLVEIDLVRIGRHVLSVPRHLIPPSHRTPCLVCVRRGWEPKKVEVYALPLQKSLPNIKVPLREADEDVALELQPLIDQCYRNGGYDDIDYTTDAKPPLDAVDAPWADELLRQAKRR